MGRPDRFVVGADPPYWAINREGAEWTNNEIVQASTPVMAYPRLASNHTVNIFTGISEDSEVAQSSGL